MHIGLIGFGKMGYNMRERLREKGIEVTGFTWDPDCTELLSLAEFVAALAGPRVIWVMVPAGQIADAVVKDLSEALSAGDMVIDGGNTKFTDDQIHATLLSRKGIRYLDCGVSGGVWGLEDGYGLMVGGSQADVEFAMPIFDALRPEGGRAESFVHVGDVGAGHYAKMVHEGIEYGLMQCYAEGYELLEAKDIVQDVHGTFAAWQKGTWCGHGSGSSW